jgi:hypothetical protein
MIRTLLAINLALALSCAAHGVQAGEWHAPKQAPDNFSDWDKHLVFVGFIPGIAIGSAKPDWPLVGKFAMCSVPGLLHEFAPGGGNRWSGRDLLVNSVGCGLGLWAAHGLRVAPQQGGMRITYAAGF